MSAVVVAGCLLFFVIVNLHNLLRYHAGFSTASQNVETEKPMAGPLLLAIVGTAAFFLESFFYVLFSFSRGQLFSAVLGTAQMIILEAVGMFVMVGGYVIFLWSVVARGPYATSWQMPVDHVFVNWGPYHYVRHPSYLGYFLMFAGFFLLSHNTLALAPLIAIPGYALITWREEEMLVARFGEMYLHYQKNVGRFFPKFSLHKSSYGPRH